MDHGWTGYAVSLEKWIYDACSLAFHSKLTASFAIAVWGGK